MSTIQIMPDSFKKYLSCLSSCPRPFYAVDALTENSVIPDERIAAVADILRNTPMKVALMRMGFWFVPARHRIFPEISRSQIHTDGYKRGGIEVRNRKVIFSHERNTLTMYSDDWCFPKMTARPTALVLYFDKPTADERLIVCCYGFPPDRRLSGFRNRPQVSFSPITLENETLSFGEDGTNYGPKLALRIS